MKHALLIAAALAALTAVPTLAQQTETTSETPAEAPAETPPADAPADQTADAPSGEPAVGDVYQRQEGDWRLVCEKTLSGEDPCRMAQLMRDANNNPVMEAELTRLAGENLPAAVMVINTPLLTLLTEGVTLTIDGGSPAKIPFMFCDNQSCVARVNLREQDVSTFKRGNVARVRIVPLAAPDNSVTVDMSLKGFTAAFDSIPALAQN
ncbi:invasion associated locus B family protein [Thalassococcus sp. CAU 1522]|uniref:Invasion associated locus B family protein n=1 Tax=Thalassococcus arenae TaxID=2851652 RepID=A0ABS6NBE1_9RHOB|nr:invasion associated locus B family protein [Thalassococcus arenae]MBV2360855.1 invasion associated locus B family protein [Thalassococcus arenae]